MNRQKIFNTVRDHLLKQDERAMDTEEVNCAYLTKDGLKCAIGCLIPDGHPGQSSERGVEGLLFDHPDLADLWGGVGWGDMKFLLNLQDIHDRKYRIPWPALLTDFAITRGLTP